MSFTIRTEMAAFGLKLFIKINKKHQNSVFICHWLISWISVEWKRKVSFLISHSGTITKEKEMSLNYVNLVSSDFFLFLCCIRSDFEHRVDCYLYIVNFCKFFHPSIEMANWANKRYEISSLLNVLPFYAFTFRSSFWNKFLLLGHFKEEKEEKMANLLSMRNFSSNQ